MLFLLSMWIIAVHCKICPIRYDTRHCGQKICYRLANLWRILRCKWSKNVVDDGPSGWRTPDTNTNTSKFLAADMGKDGFDPVMAA